MMQEVWRSSGVQFGAGAVRLSERGHLRSKRTALRAGGHMAETSDLVRGAPCTVYFV